MEIRWRLFLYVVVNCAYCVAKPVSLNEVIAAESQQKQLEHAASPKLEELATQRFSLNKELKPLLLAPKKLEETESFIPLRKKLSLFKYLKTFQIKSPLRPKRIKHSLRNRHNNKNLSVKREIGGNDKLNQKYIPLLRNLGMLFDNLLAAESSESSELRSKRKRVRYYTDTSEILCPCSTKSNDGVQSEEAAVTSAETFSDEASSPAAAPKTPNPLTATHFRGFRQNKNIPLLLPRNTLSRWRNHNGFGKRSGAAHHGSSEGNIARDHGDSEHGTRDGSYESDAKDDEENPRSYSRDNVGSFRPWRGIRDRDTSNVPKYTSSKGNGEADEIRESAATENESTLERPGGNLNNPKREDKQQIRRDEAESAELLSAPVGRLRGFISTDKVSISESELEKRQVEQDYSRDQHLAVGSRALAEENKETSTRHETVELNNIPTIRSENSITDNPLVFIIDGYSVTRTKNGENKLKEKAIHIF